MVECEKSKWSPLNGNFLDADEIRCINSLPNDKMLDWSKGFADNKSNVNEILIFGLRRLENIVGKGENASYQHFLLFPQCLEKLYVSASLGVGIVLLRVLESAKL